MQANKLLVGIAGKAGAGKDSCSKILCEKLDLQAYTIAEPVTRECACLTGMADNLKDDQGHNKFLAMNKNIAIRPIFFSNSERFAFYTDIANSYNGNQIIEKIMHAKTKRALMQYVGDAICFYNHRALIEHLQLEMEKDAGYINAINGNLVTDIRTEEEADFIRKQGGIVIHITNPNAEAAPTHRTETELSIHSELGDLHIMNDGSLAQFHNEISRKQVQLHSMIEKAA